MAPISVLIDEIFLNGVYIHTYEKIVKKDNEDTIKLILKNKYRIPATDNEKPKINALRGDTWPLGIDRFAVLSILESESYSIA